jgi:hypothetical protein
MFEGELLHFTQFLREFRYAEAKPSPQ